MRNNSRAMKTHAVHAMHIMFYPTLHPSTHHPLSPFQHHLIPNFTPTVISLPSIPILKSVPLHPLQNRKPMRRKHNTLIHRPRRSPRLLMPRPQTTSMRIFFRAPETWDVLAIHPIPSNKKKVTKLESKDRERKKIKCEKYLMGV